MALYDNRYWLLSHIRNSFVTTDDTGMCELVMTGESNIVKEKILKKEPYYDHEISDEDEDSDVYSGGMQYEDFAVRGRTAPATMEKTSKRKTSNSLNVRHVKWESSKNEDDSLESGNLFVMKEPVVQQKVKSGLSQLLQESTNIPKNPFVEYTKFDGSLQIDLQTRVYRIFLTMLPEDQRNYPLDVCCIATATVRDLIGLILLKFSTQYSNMTLKSVSNYGLYITEKNGEIDDDLPKLDATTCLVKVGFSYLGLVEIKESTKSVSFDNDEAIFTELIPDGKKRTTSTSKAEENKQYKNDMLFDVHNRAIEAPMYQSYRVYILNKVRQRIEILLGISGEKIEIDPVQQKSSKFAIGKQKAVSHHMDTVASCDILEVKSSRSVFRIVYTTGAVSSVDSSHTMMYFSPPLQPSPSFKHYDFEADKSTAEEIQEKITLLLNVRSSVSRKEYLAAKERKLSKKNNSKQ